MGKESIPAQYESHHRCQRSVDHAMMKSAAKLIQLTSRRLKSAETRQNLPKSSATAIAQAIEIAQYVLNSVRH